MITIYGSKNSSAFRCIWVLEELNIPYTIKTLDFQKGENKSSEYLALNPNGKIPTMVDGEFVLWESLAINYYLMEKYNGVWLVGKTAEEHAQVNQWNFWSLIHLYEAFHPLVMQKFRNTPDSDATKAATSELLPRYLKVLDNRLHGREYLALDTFSLADITAMSVLKNAAFVSYDISSYPHIVSWMKHISERPVYQKLTAV